MTLLPNSQKASWCLLTLSLLENDTPQHYSALPKIFNILLVEIRYKSTAYLDEAFIRNAIITAIFITVMTPFLLSTD